MKNLNSQKSVLALLPAIYFAFFSYAEKEKTFQKRATRIIGSSYSQSSQSFSSEYLLGKFIPASHPDFSIIPEQYSTKKDLFLRREVLDAFQQMHAKAAQDGISLKIISATRNFSYQKKIWEKKWRGQTLVSGKNLAITVKNPVHRAKIIMKYSAMPGTSRHHWGTDIDINSVSPSYFETQKGKKEYQWLVKHAATYGFCQVYNEKGASRSSGYEVEKWHWSYLPTARKLLQEYKTKITEKNISGFLGAETAKQLHVVENYVLAINSNCD
ncbi:M15 family metallopeptidase [Flavobacterium sp.]|uniref:M15 family metallopeptidase n=1 Tax=Flavobacterium sp. TaxID=239 RepID=UPI002637761C|nr:M15 family metallopeptidase [Flavobacterium sp.]